MRQIIAATIFISIWAFGVGIAAAQTAGSAERQQMLIESDQLLKTLHKPNVRVLDVRSEKDFIKGHIPNALRVDVSEWKNLASASNGFHDTKGWSKRISPLGLSKTTHVVVYGSKLSDTARIWWLLKYIGVKHVSILNGGWESWIKKDRPTNTSTPKIIPTNFKPDFQADRLAEIDSLKKTLKSETVKVVDTRSTSEFEAGRIPGSAHLEWKELVTEDGRFKTKTQLQQLFRKRGILPTETAVCY